MSIASVLLWPFRKLYREGPALLGFWENLPEADVCAQITGVHAEFWRHNSVECHERIVNRIQAWEVLVLVLLTYAIIMGLLCMLCSRFLLINPITREFRHIREKICGPTKRCESVKSSPSG